MYNERRGKRGMHRYDTVGGSAAGGGKKRMEYIQYVQ
jgi:hypothetical protein